MTQMNHTISFMMFLPLCASTLVFASVSGDHGLDDLIARVGLSNTPTGAGVEVGQVEGTDVSGGYIPDVNFVEFTGKTFNVISGASVVSNHATQVGMRYYGTGGSGIAPGIDIIDLFSAEGWIFANYLRFSLGGNPSAPPGQLKIFNNSWVATFNNLSVDKEILRRADWAVDRHDVLIFNGVANSGAHAPLMGFGFNTISVGKEDGAHTGGTVPAGYDLPGRQLPLIVAAQGTTSNATGVASAAGALLIETARTHPNTSGNFFATLSETLKAVLLTGGKHLPGWTNNPSTSGPTRGVTTQPIDDVFGVGTVNIDRAHRVMTGGQHTSSTSPIGLSTAPPAAWETWTLSNNESRYIKCAVTSLASEVSIVLTWHQLSNSNFSAYNLSDLDLILWKLTKGSLVDITGDAGIGVFASGNVVSQSSVDNVEHLYIQNLIAGEYVIEVRRVDSTSGARAFSVGWLFPEPASVLGDVNGDGLVNITDILAIITAWGPCGASCPEDLNGDSTVDVLDLLFVISNW